MDVNSRLRTLLPSWKAEVKMIEIHVKHLQTQLASFQAREKELQQHIELSEKLVTVDVLLQTSKRTLEFDTSPIKKMQEEPLYYKTDGNEELTVFGLCPSEFIRTQCRIPGRYRLIAGCRIDEKAVLGTKLPKHFLKCTDLYQLQSVVGGPKNLAEWMVFMYNDPDGVQPGRPVYVLRSPDMFYFTNRSQWSWKVRTMLADKVDGLL